MNELSGPTSDRIRSGDIPAKYLEKSRLPVDDRPADWAVKGGSGYGLGEGATRRRSGPGAITHDHQLGEADMSRDQHLGEAMVAATLAGEAQDLCSQLTSQVESLIATTIAATGGDDSNSEAGRNATHHARAALEHCSEVFASLEFVVGELGAYANGL